MKVAYFLSIAFNFIILSCLLFLILNGRKLLEKIFVRIVLDKRHQQKLSMFTTCPKKTGAIIFLGDSITEGGNWEELYEGKTVLNRGIGGDTSEGVLNRLDEVLRHKPSKLFICIGTNDIARGVSSQDFINNYQKIIKRVQQESPSTKLYIQSLFPVGEKVFYGHNNASILVFNTALQGLCKAHEIPYLDLHDAFADSDGNLKSELTNDKLHLLGSAYLLWKDLIAEQIEK